MYKINADNSVTIDIAEYNYKSVFMYDDLGGTLAKLSTAEVSTFANAKVTEIYQAMLSITKTVKRKQLDDYVNTFISNSLAKYSSYEQGTFVVQQMEWTAHSADQTSATPYIDQLASARGITRAACLAAVGVKISFFVGILGIKQGVSDSIKLAATKSDVDAIDMPTLI